MVYLPLAYLFSDSLHCIGRLLIRKICPLRIVGMRRMADARILIFFSLNNLWEQYGWVTGEVTLSERRIYHLPNPTSPFFFSKV